MEEEYFAKFYAKEFLSPRQALAVAFRDTTAWQQSATKHYTLTKQLPTDTFDKAQLDEHKVWLSALKANISIATIQVT